MNDIYLQENAKNFIEIRGSEIWCNVVPYKCYLK